MREAHTSSGNKEVEKAKSRRRSRKEGYGGNQRRDAKKKGALFHIHRYGAIRIDTTEAKASESISREAFQK